MQQALYRKYRSKALSEVLGQEHVTETLQRGLDKGQLSHAYLLTGPHGVGKTSIARILAHNIAKLEYSGENHLDIIEIDAASNRRIDEVRDLRDKARILPTSAERKVYIIDEVHMLTTEAFNALLKTLEEPPEHVVFILATTEAHKLPDTIISRTQRFQLLPISAEVLKKRLKYIASQEKIAIDDDALELLTVHAKGSFRDAISLFDQVAISSEKKIDVPVVQNLLGVIAASDIMKLLSSIDASDAQAVQGVLDDLFARGYTPQIVAAQLIEMMHEKLREQTTPMYIQLSKELLLVQSSAMPEYALRIACIEATYADVVVTPNSAALAATQPKTTKPITQANSPAKSTPREDTNDTAAPQTPRTTSKNPEWDKLLAGIKQSNNALYALLRMARMQKTDDSIELAFKFPFHVKRVEQAGNKAVLDKAITQSYGPKTTYSCVVDASLDVRPVATSVEEPIVARPSSEAETVRDIMGGGEVVAYEESA